MQNYAISVEQPRVYAFLTFRFKQCFPLQETLQTVLSKLGKALCGLLWGLDFLEIGLAVELISIANQLLFQCFRQEILMRQRQILADDLLFGQSRAGMPLTYAGMPGIAFRAHQLRAQAAVTDIRLCAMAGNAGRVTAKDADVVEHSCLFDKLPVEFQLGMTVANLQSPRCHSTAVNKQNMAQLIVGRIILVYDLLIIHIKQIHHPPFSLLPCRVVTHSDGRSALTGNKEKNR